MKKKLVYLIVLLSVIFIPFNTQARELDIAGEKYNVKYYLELMQDEGIEPTVPDFTESTDKINIYLFYGKGCEHCTNLINFLNNIAPEYKEKFNIAAFEIYGDEKNSKLLTKIANGIGEDDDGVPFIFIGDQYYNGYSSEYDDLIKKAIDKNYEIKPEERQDVIASFTRSVGGGSSSSLSTSTKIILADVFLTILSTVVIIIFVNKKIDSLDIKKKK